MSKAALDRVFYDYGKQQQDFFMQILYKKPNGITIASPRKKYIEMALYDYDDVLKEKFLDEANNRSILGKEVVIDIDDPSIIDNSMEKIRKDQLNYLLYRTGSKGYHIHIFFPNLPFNDEEDRCNMIEWRTVLVRRYGGDMMKVFNNSMIALEDAPHWKTGKKKQMIDSKEYGRNECHPWIYELMIQKKDMDEMDTLRAWLKMVEEMRKNKG